MSHAAAQADLEFGGGTFLFRIPATLVQELQNDRGTKVTWADGSFGKRPKAIGAIWREHVSGLYLLGAETVIDHSALNFDPADSRAIVFFGLLGGGAGLVNGERVSVDRIRAKQLLEEHFDTWPIKDQWTFAAAVLTICCEGYTPKKDAPPGNVEAA